MMKYARLIPVTFLFGLMISCEPKEETDPTPAGPVYGDTIATKTGKGFTSLAILATTAAGGGANGGAYDDFKMVDMTLLPDGKSLQLATVATLTTQQDPLNTVERRALDIETKGLLAGPTSNIGNLVYASFPSSNSYFSNRNFGYVPGTTKFFSTSYSVSNFGIVTGTVVGDISYTRSATFATQPRVTALGEVVEDLITQTTVRIDGNSNNQIFFNYRKDNRMSANFYAQRVVNPNLVKSLVIRGGNVEPSK